MNLVYYSNRKMYSSDLKRYVTILECIELLKSGSNVTIYNYKSGVDCTPERLKEMIVKMDVPTKSLLKFIKEN